MRLRLRKLLTAVRHLHKGPIRRGLARGVLPSAEHLPVLTSLRLSHIIDVGANRGQFSLAARIAHPKASILAIEPLSEAVEVYRRSFTGDWNTVAVQAAAAAGSYDGVLNVARASDSSSLLMPTGRQMSTFPRTDIVARRHVRTVALDDLPNVRALRRPALLKIDVQGAELDVLRGTNVLLDVIDYVLVEASFTELYTGQALAVEVIDFLRTRGFKLARVDNAVCDDAGAVVQADMLFVSRHEVMSSGAHRD